MSSAHMTLDEQRHLVTLLNLAFHDRSLRHLRSLPNVIGRNGQLKLEGPYQREDQCLHPSGRVEVSRWKMRNGESNVLHKSESVSDACARTTDECEHVTPNSRYLRDGLWGRLPSFWLEFE